MGRITKNMKENFMKKFLIFFAFAHLSLCVMPPEKVYFFDSTDLGTRRTYVTASHTATLRITPDGTQLIFAYNKRDGVCVANADYHKTFANLEAAYKKQQAKLLKTNS